MPFKESLKEMPFKGSLNFEVELIILKKPNIFERYFTSPKFLKIF